MSRTNQWAALYALILTPILACGTGCNAGTAEPEDTAAQDWEIVWSDEFDYTGVPDSSKWGYDVGGHGWGNQELEYYTEARPENARVEDGHLVIEARRDNWNGHEYTSARLVTKGKGDWTYGRFEARARLPAGLGTWPAIWMLASKQSYGEGYWPDNGEIDIMEEVGFDPNVIHGSIHTAAYNHVIGTQKTATINVPTSQADFHVYAAEWTPEEIKISVDDSLYFTFKNERLSDPQAGYEQWPFDKPFHLLLNVAVGGSWGGQEGVDPNIWPQRMLVDYVRVYRRP
ncbi:MAG TPA: glycoside hydrolase family 16 protein [Rhodothermales bacterium]|nr:glycoside hydrolase family 16 protein [Rhodothermales bacterium]